MERHRLLTVGSCFAGIGGIELGLERTGGFKTKWQIESDWYATLVLHKHWKRVQRFGDIKVVDTGQLKKVDVVVGGFPCQDISNAGRGAGLAGHRSGLWRELYRTICVVRPKYAIVENVAALLGRGMGTVLGDLAEGGYDAEWDCLPAAAVGAPHYRDRVFITSWDQRFTNSARPQIWGRHDKDETRESEEPFGFGISDWWSTEPPLSRVANGIPRQLDRRRCLGNAVVPQVAQRIGEMILAAEAASAQRGAR